MVLNGSEWFVEQIRAADAWPLCGLSRCRGHRHAAVLRLAFPPVSQSADSTGYLFDEIPDVANGPPPFRQNVRRQWEVVNLSVPEMKIAANPAGFQALRHELGVREQ